MKKKKYKGYFYLYLLIHILILLFLLFPSFVFAQEEIPLGLQKIIDYNKQNAADFSVKISFFIAFVAGVLVILSPCILPFFPAYFSYTFKEKKNMTKMTLVFFFGFSIVFVTMGAIAGLIGEQVLFVLQEGWLVTLAGLFIIFLGIMTIFGKGLPSLIKFKFRYNAKAKDDFLGVFFLGVSFSLGWTACVGPILAGILGIGAILGNIGYSALLLFFYSLGNLVPLFILSMLYDRFNFSQNRFIQGKLFTASVAGKKYYFHSTNLISGLLFLIIGAVLLIYKGTAVVNTLDPLGTKFYFYSVQRQLIEWKYANILGFILFIAFILLIGFFLWKYRNHTKNNKSK